MRGLSGRPLRAQLDGYLHRIIDRDFPELGHPSGGEHEVDLIIEREDGRVLAVEFKLARDIGGDDVRHLTWLARQIGNSLIDAIVVTTGEEAYRRPDGIAVVPAALIGV